MTVTKHFEERLLAQLRHVVAENPAPSTAARQHRQRNRVALAAAGCGIALAAVAVVAGSGGGTTSAYAVKPQPGGAVEVSISRVGDAAGLQRSLEESGIPALVYFDSADRGACTSSPATDDPSQGSPRRDQPGGLKAYETADGGVWAELPPGEQWADPSAHSRKENAVGDLSDAAIAEAGGATFLVDPSRIETGEKLIITTSDGTVETLRMTVSSQSSDCGS